MTVTITATMDSLFLRFFILLCFHFKPFTNKKKLDYICLVAWFMVPDGDAFPPFKFLHFYTKQKQKRILVLFSPSANTWRKMSPREIFFC